MSDTLITEGFLALSEAAKSGRKKRKERARLKLKTYANKRKLSSTQKKYLKKGMAAYAMGVGVGGLVGSAAFPKAPQKLYRKIQNMRYSG